MVANTFNSAGRQVYMLTIQDIQQAQKTIQGVAQETPIMTSSTLSGKAENKVFLKGEHLQRTGAFKIRGAANKIKNVVQEGATSIVTASSGNHGQAVAYIGYQLGVETTVVVPETISPMKEAAIRGYGAQVEYCGTTSEERIHYAKAVENAEGAVYIPPYDDALVMAGQGTVGLEVLNQVPNVDTVVVPIGGWGLISGIATTIKETNPAIQVIGVEPVSANDTFLSKKQGKPVKLESTDTIADGLRALRPGEETFPIITKYVDDIVLVSDAEIKDAFTFLLGRMKQLVEPSGAASVAAVLHRKIPVAQKNIVSVVSGGNMSLGDVGDLIND